MFRKFFTLIEIMVVVALLAFILTLFNGSVKSDPASKINEAIMFIERIQVALDKYYVMNGSYPGNAGVGKNPKEDIAKYMHDADLTDDTPLGGSWHYHTNGKEVYLYFKDVNDEYKPYMDMLDSALDDGNLKTGYFVSQGSKQFNYLIAEVDKKSTTPNSPNKKK